MKLHANIFVYIMWCAGQVYSLDTESVLYETEKDESDKIHNKYKGFSLASGNFGSNTPRGQTEKNICQQQKSRSCSLRASLGCVPFAGQVVSMNMDQSEVHQTQGHSSFSNTSRYLGYSLASGSLHGPSGHTLGVVSLSFSLTLLLLCEYIICILQY